MSESIPPTTPPPSGPPPGQRTFLERLQGALTLDASTYEEVEHDADALPQALGVVALAALCAGIGSANEGAGGLFGGIVAAGIGWLLSAGVVWLVGVLVLKHTSDYPELLRTIGFAQAPQLALLLGSLPILGWIVRLAVFFWGLAAYVVAVRQALDVETQRAVLVCLLAWGLSVLVALAFSGLAASCGAGPHGMPG